MCGGTFTTPRVQPPARRDRIDDTRGMGLAHASIRDGLLAARFPASYDARTDAGGAPVRTTVTIDDELLARAVELTGVTERSALLRAGLETLIRVESARRLARMGGSWSTPRSGSTTSTSRSRTSSNSSRTTRSAATRSSSKSSRWARSAIARHSSDCSPTCARHRCSRTSSCSRWSTSAASGGEGSARSMPICWERSPSRQERCSGLATSG